MALADAREPQNGTRNGRMAMGSSVHRGTLLEPDPGMCLELLGVPCIGEL